MRTMTGKINKHILKNGMVILGEPMEHLSSVSFMFRLGAGSARLPKGCCGAASVIADWIFRGAGARNSRQLVDALEGLGLHRSNSITADHLSLAAALEAGNLIKAIPLYADIILRPALEDDQFELSKKQAIQEVVSLDDDPRHKVMLKLYEQFYPSPLGSPAMGKLDDLKALNAQTTAGIINEKFNLSQSIFAVAGKYNFDAVCDMLEELFDASGPEKDTMVTPGDKGKVYTHYHNDGAQIHIGLMTRTVPITDSDYYNAMTAVSILSGSMGSRLFTEVREKRGLCYAIGAQYNTLKHFAGISCYAGTTPDKAQQTLDVIISEFARLCEGITEDELQRAKVGLKSSLIMQGESSSSRVSQIASDHYVFGQVRTLDEIKQKLEQVSIESVERFLKNNRFDEYTIVTIGPDKIKV